MNKALIPGSFDPITVGHLDIIRRAAEMYDEVTVLVAKNSAKNYMLCTGKRARLIEDAVKNLKNVKVDSFDGTLVDYVATNGKPVIVKGLRNSTDFEYEQNMAFYNRELSVRKYGFSAETLFLVSLPCFSEVSSSLVRTLLGCGTGVDDLVPNAKLLKNIVAE